MRAFFVLRLMKYRKLTADGDYTFGQQQADFYRDSPQAVVQAVGTRLHLLRGEWFLDTREGMPWHTEVLGKYTAPGYDNSIRQHILGTQGVMEISAYESVFDPERRSLRVRATVSTVYGSAELELALP